MSSEEPETSSPGHGNRRTKTIGLRGVSLRDLKEGQKLYPVEKHPPLPETRGECEGGPRPCPMVSCKYHLYLSITPAGSITYNYPGKEVEELEESCALDVADRGGATLEEVGELFHITRERIRQIEAKAKIRLRRLPILQEIERSGGIDDTDRETNASFSDGGGGHGEGREEVEVDPLAERAWRTYERMSRLPGEVAEALPSAQPAMNDVQEASEEVETEEAANDAAPVQQELVEEAMKAQKDLADREQTVYDAYCTLANELGQRPGNTEVAKRTGLKYSSMASASAGIAGALRRIADKGYELPFFDQKLPKSRSTTEEEPKKQKKGGRRKKSEALEQMRKAIVAKKKASGDPLVDNLRERRAALEEQMKDIDEQIVAIDTLLKSLGYDA